MKESTEESEEVHERKWKKAFFPLAWSGHIGLGMALGIFGPTQPYLAKNVSVSLDTINFIWSGRSLGFMITSVVTAMVFKKYCTSTLHKMAFLALAQAVTGGFVMLVPWARTFPFLLCLVSLFGMTLGCFDTADNSLMVYMMGPVKSRPFTQSLHAFVGVGFVLGGLLVQPFLPKTNSGTDSVCPGEEGEGVVVADLVNYQANMMAGVDSIAWPFIIIGAWLLLTSVGMLLLGCSSLKMPSFYDKEENEDQKNTSQLTSLPRWPLYLAMIYCYYVLSCGMEGFFQSMTYTYALCGPLRLMPLEANIINILYLAAFLVGRSSGVFISRIISPTKIIIGSISGCIASCTLLSILASHHKIALYVGVILMGFSIAFQFASGISWTAELFNVTGRASFIFFLGGFSGFLSFPPMAGAIITSEGGQENFFYLALGTSIAQAGLFSLMSCLARRRTK